MGEPPVKLTFRSEAELARGAGEAARRWFRIGVRPLLIGLGGDLGSGKTTWVRAMLRGLGYEGRVPSPTYTLLEQYAIEDLTIVHVDLYRLAAGEELENIGVRDWLAESDLWMLVEWPERAEPLFTRCDLMLEIAVVDSSTRSVTAVARTEAGATAIGALSDLDSSYVI
jgi:tRNA threonylcarbamoyladenosine biosynthesis protein TsaE